MTFLHTPGHTPGSQCFLVDGRLISGDTLFIRSCGRTDLPGSDPSEMYRSLTQRLGALPDDTVVFPGHNYGGAATTIGDEKRHNPMMRFSVHGRLPSRHGRLEIGRISGRNSPSTAAGTPEPASPAASGHHLAAGPFSSLWRVSATGG